MLVLSRKTNEKIVITIGEQTVTVIVVHIGPGKVKLAIDAPKEIKICRDDSK